MADATPKSEPEREETPEPEPIPEKGYSLSMELVEFKDLNYDDEIFGIPEDQDEQTFCQESAEGDNSEVSEEETAELEGWPNSSRRFSKENQAADQGITEDVDPGVEDLVDIQNNKGDTEQAQAELVKGKNQKEIDNSFRWLLEEDSEEDETEEEAEARLIAENNAQWERCLEYQRKYCEEYSSNGNDDDEPEPPQDFRGNTMHEDVPSNDEEFYDNRNSIWE
ncbi:hypothetical protein B0H16DRAFT_1448271 [Mycena metata]|uniref:Uncharacterized protein n=1 Tax=Mycena metata TaxID=1033252 RepID=A0AAD7NXZ5_9AGAR|nr:hypothetical protein B0H16DRAFT_1448271 [Mycena metata]